MKSQFSLRQPTAVLIVVTISAMLISRILSTVWLWERNDARSHFIPIVWMNMAIELLLLAIGFVVVRRLVIRDRSRRAQQSRLDHAADVAFMAGGFAHEARNHLHAMQTHFALLRKKLSENDEQCRKRVGKLEEVTGELDQLLTDFLTYARPAVDEWQETDLEQLVRQVVDFESLEFERDGVVLRVECRYPLFPVYIDQGKFKRALLNLLINARQAIDGEGKVTVRLSSTRAGAQIEVEDTGAGIPLEDQRRVFETFFTTKSAGTGLGLAVVRRTIEDAGGKITFSSKPGIGTRFVVRLPTLRNHQATVRRRKLDRAAISGESTVAAS